MAAQGELSSVAGQVRRLRALEDAASVVSSAAIIEHCAHLRQPWCDLPIVSSLLERAPQWCVTIERDHVTFGKASNKGTELNAVFLRADRIPSGTAYGPRSTLGAPKGEMGPLPELRRSGGSCVLD
jgi:hypothetical protein